MKKIIDILLYIWQLPQNIVGLITWAIMKEDKSWIEEYKGEKLLFSHDMSGGISLGKYIILKAWHHAGKWEESTTVNHEYGHSRQSKILGPLYLLVIGIPSIIWAGLCTYMWPDKDYFKFYTEAWADKLGGVERK